MLKELGETDNPAAVLADRLSTIFPQPKGATAPAGKDPHTDDPASQIVPDLMLGPGSTPAEAVKVSTVQLQDRRGRKRQGKNAVGNDDQQPLANMAANRRGVS